MFKPDSKDVKVAMSLIRKHGSRAIAEANQKLQQSALHGDRAGASLWMRVSAVVEFAELRVVVHCLADVVTTPADPV